MPSPGRGTSRGRTAARSLAQDARETGSGPDVSVIERATLGARARRRDEQILRWVRPAVVAGPLLRAPIVVQAPILGAKRAAVVTDSAGKGPWRERR